MFKIYFYLLVGVLVVSSSSILIRSIGDVSYTVIAFYRLSIAMFALLAIHISSKKKSISSLKTFHWHYLLAGLFLAAHLITWIASLQMTTIANSIFLEGTHPIFAVLFSIIFLKEYPSKKTIPLFIIATLGMFLIVYSDLNSQDTRILGDILAIMSAMLLALYLMIARMHKNEPDLIKYLIYVYGAASVFCLVYIGYAGNNLTGFSTKSWIFIFIVGLGPNLFGHSLLNWASRHIEIYKVNMALLLEPVLATITGMIFVAEFPKLNFYIAAGLIMTSVVLLVYIENKKGSKD